MKRKLLINSVLIKKARIKKAGIDTNLKSQPILRKETDVIRHGGLTQKFFPRIFESHIHVLDISNKRDYSIFKFMFCMIPISARRFEEADRKFNRQRLYGT